MTEKNQYEEMFAHMQALLDLVREKGGSDHIDESKVTPEIRARIVKLEQDIKEFAALNTKITDLTNISNQILASIVEVKADDVEALAEAEHFQKKANSLNDQALALQKTLAPNAVIKAGGPDIIEKKEKDDADESDEVFQKRRRRKFRQFGNDRDLNA